MRCELITVPYGGSGKVPVRQQVGKVVAGPTGQATLVQREQRRT
ncbi:MAG TPA: hypothetical protein VNS49_01405 [Streptomyces sp.]|nr:hypothetical protein [Streptomyces sp.]